MKRVLLSLDVPDEAEPRGIVVIYYHAGRTVMNVQAMEGGPVTDMQVARAAHGLLGQLIEAERLPPPAGRPA